MPPHRGRRRDEKEAEKPPEPPKPAPPTSGDPLPPIKDLKRTLAPLMPSIVKIRVVESAPDYAIPWQQSDTEESSGSGCVITLADGTHRVLTNAHVVHNHTFVRLQKQGSAHQYLANVLHVSYDCDLAVLEVEDEAFYKGCTPMVFAPTPNLQDTVIVLGYPEGGDSISVTKGIVSRLELSNMVGGHFGITHDDGLKLLSLQIDAALNPGNSGGPAVNEHNQIIGIVFSKLTWSENVGYLVPSEVVLHFLKDIESGRKPEFCSPGFYYQSCENTSLRAKKKIPPGESGVLVIAVDPMSPASDGTLQRGDVILRVDGVPIADDGTISAQAAGISAAEHLRLSFEYLISVRKHVGDSVAMTILRNGEKKEIATKVAARQYLVPPFSLLPSYFLHAGLLFVPLSEPYLNATDAELPVIGRVFYRNTKSFSGEEIVVIMKVLTDEVNIGFDRLELPKQVVSLNGTKIKNLAHLMELMEGCKDRFLEVELDSGEQIIIDAAKARDSNPRIMRRYKVHSLKSANFQRAVGNGKNGK